MNSNHVFEEFDLPRSLVEDIANNLSDAIIEGKIHPGQQIIETDLQRALGVSRAPVREALLKLEGRGLVKMIPRKGAFVRSITPRFIQESFTMRAWLEGLGARLAMENIGSSECDQLEKILSDMAKLARQKDFKGYFYRHWDFHRFFYKASQNELLINRIETMRRESLWLSYSITYFEKNHGLAQKIHKTIIDLFRKGSADEVEMTVRSHILNATEHYVKFIKETYPKLAES